MRRRYICFVISSLLNSVALLTGCAADDSLTNEGRGEGGGDPVGQPVLFSVGNVGENVTRAAIPYMAQDGRFVCTMYYHPWAGSTDASDFDITHSSEGGTSTTTWLLVNNTVGNSIYWDMEYAPHTGTGEVNEYGYKEATMFYWQNRLTHAFLALADYNRLKTNVGAASVSEESENSTQGKLKMYPYGDLEPAVNTYDLTRGDKTSMSQQPDPILALTVMKPAGATQEANRVRLYFKHQFSQIQVNVKGADDNSANIVANQIDKVELLGISTEGYVVTQLNANGSVGIITSTTQAGDMNAASAKVVHLDEFSDAVLDDNQWGTSFSMFDMATGTDADDDGNDDGYPSGYLKSFNAIAFGRLDAIRVTWFEGTPEAKGVIHKSTYVVLSGDDVELNELQSGVKYIYNLELRRGTLAVIRPEIVDWDQESELVYDTPGTIKPTATNE